MNNYFRLFLIALVGISIAGLILAARAANDDTQQLASLDAEQFVDLAKSVGATDFKITVSSSEFQSITFNVDRLRYIAFLKVRSADGKFRGIMLNAVFRQEENKPPITLKELNDFNITYAFAPGFQLNSEIYYFSKYIITDGGISLANLKANMQTFWQIPSLFFQNLSKQQVATMSKLVSKSGTQEATGSASTHTIFTPQEETALRRSLVDSGRPLAHPVDSTNNINR